MSLMSLPLQYTYRSDLDTMHKDFFEPCLKASKFYDRAAGYFSSNVLKRLAKGFEVFLFCGGKIRIVTNIHLSSEDIDAIEKGHKAKKNIIEQNLLREITICEENLKDNTLNVMAWLISKGQLEIKIAHPNNNSLYHEKFGIFTDEFEHSVGFNGSANETFNGISTNFEKVDVFFKDSEKHRIERMKMDFEKLWNNETNGLTVIDIPTSIKERILKSRKKLSKVSKELKPREYQLTAIELLKKNQWTGILEMATGTGKTITSILAAMQYLEENKRLFLVIVVPFAHLVDQWRRECEKFGLNQITLCYNSTKLWFRELESVIQNYNIGLVDKHVVITTYKTAALNSFNELSIKIADNAFLIADECHYLGTRTFWDIEFSNYTARVGLSATPQRWWDEDGTNFITNVFSKVVYEFTLQQAINEGKLTQYEYFPHIVHLAENELDSYKKLTLRIIRLHNSKKHSSEEKIQRLNRERALILAKAEGKIPALIKSLEQKGLGNISHTLVYVAPGQVNEITGLLNNLGLRVHRFDSLVPNQERKKVLDSFAKGEIQILVAIKCLDEGVDVPSTRVAYFLASTSNPREFVQRRGRILRTYKGKIISEIHDFIVFPDGVDDEMFKMIAKKELPRFAEFSSGAINNSNAKLIMNEHLDYYNLSYLMDRMPWEVYKEMKEAHDNDDSTEY